MSPSAKVILIVVIGVTVLGLIVLFALDTVGRDLRAKAKHRKNLPVKEYTNEYRLRGAGTIGEWVDGHGRVCTVLMQPYDDYFDCEFKTR